jgi:predicted secreted protein
MKIRIASSNWHIGALLVLMALLAACGGAASGPENVYIADENDNGQTVTMAAGDALQISLPENRSTGYVWSIVTNDEAVLRPADEPAYVIEGEPLPGAGGRVTFTFTAVGAGEVSLQLINARPAETAVEPVQTFALSVRVTD